MATPLLEVEGVSVEYDVADGRRVTALAGVDLRIDEGEIVGIIGESGCGKSTLAGAIMRLLPTNSRVSGGHILFAGRDLTSLSDAEMRQVRGGEIAMVFQDPLTSLNPSFRVGTQMLDIARAHLPSTARAHLREGAVAVLGEVGLSDVDARLRAYPYQCSGGMRQRILIATGLQLRPKLLIADEITSALDVTLERQIVELLRKLRDDHGTAIAFICHDLGVVASMTDRVAIMYAGRVVEEGPTRAVFSHPRHPYTLALLGSAPSYKLRRLGLIRIPGRVAAFADEVKGCAFADRCPLAQDVCRQVDPPLVQIGESLSRCHFAADVQLSERATARASQNGGDREERAAADEIVSVEGLSVNFEDHRGLASRWRGERSGVRAVDGVDLTIREGEILGLVGESGAGKSTLGRAIVGLVRPSAGCVRFAGRDLNELRPRALRRLRRELQLIFQDAQASLDPRQRVRELLTEPYEIHPVQAHERQSPEELLEAVELSPAHVDKYPHQLSGGQARRIGIARCLALHPRFLVADEPTAGLDVSAAAGVLDLMLKLRAEKRLTYLFITHNLNLLGYAADRVAVMYLGQIVELGRADEIFERPAHPYTVALLSAVADAVTVDERAAHQMLAAGEIPSARNPPAGCRYHTRCPLARDVCRTTPPPLTEIRPGRLAACHFSESVLSDSVVQAITPRQLRVAPSA